MAFQTGLEGRPWYWGLGLGVVMAGVIYLLGHQLLFKGMQSEIGTQQERMTQLETQIQKGRAAQRRLPKFREEVAGLEVELAKLLEVLPSRRNTAALMRRVRALAEMGDFNLLRFKPGKESMQDFYYEWPISILLEGGYHNLAVLFDRIGRFSRIINVENLKVEAKKGGSAHSLSASFQVKTFVYREDDEPASSTGARP